MNIDWSKAPEWVISHALYCLNNKVTQVWVGVDKWQDERGKAFPYGGGTGDSRHNPMRYQFQYETLRPVAWSGEGLPPVGVVCEIRHPDLGWARCEIVAHKHFECGSKPHAIAWIDGDTIDQSQGNRFRPIRTPEQIAAEEREHAVSEMFNMFYSEADIGKAAMFRLYDAGYRKQVKP